MRKFIEKTFFLLTVHFFHLLRFNGASGANGAIVSPNAKKKRKNCQSNKSVTRSGISLELACIPTLQFMQREGKTLLRLIYEAEVFTESRESRNLSINCLRCHSSHRALIFSKSSTGPELCFHFHPTRETMSKALTGKCIHHLKTPLNVAWRMKAPHGTRPLTR